MPETSGDLVQGTLEMLILKTLALEPMHGYGIALRIEQISDGAFRVNPGSLLPALSRWRRPAASKPIGAPRRITVALATTSSPPPAAKPSKKNASSGAVKSPPSTKSSKPDRSPHAAQPPQRNPRPLPSRPPQCRNP